jgi:hypothetical protein
MKKITLIFILMLSFIAQSEEENIKNFSILKVDTNHYLFENNTNKSIQLKTYNGAEPQLIKTTKKGNYILVHYKAGSTGTSKIISHIHVVLFNFTKNKFNKIYPYKYVGLPDENQPFLKIKKSEIIFKDSF